LWLQPLARLLLGFVAAPTRPWHAHWPEQPTSPHFCAQTFSRHYSEQNILCSGMAVLSTGC